MNEFSAALHFSASFFEYRTRLNNNGFIYTAEVYPHMSCNLVELCTYFPQ